MKDLRSLCVALLPCVLFAGCGSTNPFGPATGAFASGNWSLSLVDQAPGDSVSLTTMGGGALTATSGNVTGTLHLVSNCFLSTSPAQETPFADVPVTGAIKQEQITLTSAAVNGQSLSFSGTLSTDGTELLSGSFSVSGGCADKHHGAVTGQILPSISNTWVGVSTPFPSGAGLPVTPSFASPVQMTLTLAQGATPDVHGVYSVAGSKVHVSGSACFSQGTIQDGFLTGVTGPFFLANVTMDDGSKMLLVLLVRLPQSHGGAITLQGAATVLGGNCDRQGGEFDFMAAAPPPA